jgi:hypothetical protein
MTRIKSKRGVMNETWHLPDLRRPVDLSKLGVPGTYPDVEEKAAWQLARAIHAAESTSFVTSWSAQVQAQAFINSHGLKATLDESTRLEALRLPDADN